MEVEVLFIWSIFNTCFLLFQTVVGDVYFSCSAMVGDDSISEQFWNVIKLEVLLLLFTHMFPFWFMFKILNIQEVRWHQKCEWKGRAMRELFCLVWSNSFGLSWGKFPCQVVLEHSCICTFRFLPLWFCANLCHLFPCHLHHTSQTEWAESCGNSWSHQKQLNVPDFLRRLC